MLKINHLLIFVSILIALSSSLALFFVVSDEKTCFTVEQPKDTPIVFAYEILDEGNEINFDLFYGTSPVPDLLIMHKVLSNAVDHVDFMADNSGFFSVCVSKATISEKHPVRFKLMVNYGYDSEYYEKLSNEQNFDVLNMEVHKLNDLMVMTLNEADYQKHNEVDFHNQTESMDNAALWWPMFQIGILVVTGIFQVQHLKRFFKANKLI